MQRLLVSYDIGCPRRRRRAAQLLIDHGERVQESVYELLLRPGEWALLREALDDLIDPQADQWRVWPLCDTDRTDAIELGQPAPHPADHAIVI